MMDLLNSKTNKSQRESTDCQLEYKPHNLEIKMWSLAISWLTEILKQKTENGHCRKMEHTHGKREPRKCPIGMHRQNKQLI